MSEPTTPAARLAAARARAATAYADYRATSWQLPQVCTVLDKDVPALVTLGGTLLALLEELDAEIDSGIVQEAGDFLCPLCGGHNDGYDGPIDHTPECLITRARAVLAGTEGGAP